MGFTSEGDKGQKYGFKPVYFFYGEEIFPALEFIEEVKKSLSIQEKEEAVVEKYELGTDSWADIMDSARTLPLISSSFRLIEVEIPPRKNPNVPKKEEKLSSAEEALLKSYLSSPCEKTILFLVFNQKIRGDSPLLKFFQSLSKKNISIKEIQPLKGRDLYAWIKKQIQKEGKNIEHEACQRLVEFAGNDLRRLSSELNKLVTFIGKRDRIGLEDVEKVSGWVKPFIDWEIINSLEEADYKKCVFTLDKLLEKENIHPVIIMDKISGFFNDIFLAKLRLLEGNKDRNSIFKEIKPFIPKKYKNLYQSKFKQIIDFAEQVPVPELRYYMDRLKDIDLKVKSTALSFHELMDGFFFDYCQRRGGQKGPL